MAILVFDLLSLALGVVATGLWFTSWRVDVPVVGFGLEALDNVSAFTEAIHKQGKWTSYASFTTAGALACQIASKAISLLSGSI